MDQWLNTLTPGRAWAIVGGVVVLAIVVAILRRLGKHRVQDEENRQQINQAVITLNERLSMLADTMRATQHLMLRIGESQSTLGPALHRLADQQGGDEATRTYLRNIEGHLQRLLAETEQGRSRATADLRNDLRLLTRTVAALAEPQR